MFPHPRDSTFWRYIAQVFIGLFFCAAAYYKLTDSFFGMADVPLNVVFDYWMKQGYPVWFYKNLMLMAAPYLGYVSAAVILMQGLFGLMMIYNVGKRTAALILFLVQINIFLATFHHTGFNVFVGLSLWIALYYLLQQYIEMRRWIWAALTVALCTLIALHLRIRFSAGDPWISAYGWQRQHFVQNVMSISPLIKHIFLWISQGTIGMYLWAGMWWLQGVLAIGLLTRWRLQSGIVFVLYSYFRAIVWTNVVGSDGVLWTLVLFIFITQEEFLQSAIGGRYSFLPFLNRQPASMGKQIQPVVKNEKQVEQAPLPKKMDALTEAPKTKEQTKKEKEQTAIDGAPDPIS